MSVTQIHRLFSLFEVTFRTSRSRFRAAKRAELHGHAALLGDMAILSEERFYLMTPLGREEVRMRLDDCTDWGDRVYVDKLSGQVSLARMAPDSVREFMLLAQRRGLVSLRSGERCRIAA